MNDANDPAAAVERAMVAMRRSQSRRALAHLARQGRDLGVEVGVFGVLDAVEEGARTVTEVARALTVDQPRASRLVAQAVRAGLVVREADQADGRRALLALTARGRALLERVHRFRRGMAERAMEDWSAADRAAFAELLPRFVEAFTRITTDTGRFPGHQDEKGQ